MADVPLESKISAASATREDSALVDASVSSRTWFGHPRAMFLVALTEMWERFSYWGMLGILVLFLTAAPATGGWGWGDARALQFYGWYAGLAFALPVVGAWIANNFLSERRCIFWGGIAILIGHVLLAASPAFAHAGHYEVPVFLTGLMLILGGTALLKPTISSIVALLYPQGGARRDEGFSYFFVAIYIGALLGAVVVGYLGERVGWHYGFASAAVGMTLGLTCYVAKQREWLGEIGKSVRVRAHAQPQPLTRIEWQRMGVIAVQGLFTIVYAVGFFQSGGLLNLYAQKHMDRHLAGFEVPTTWLLSISVWVFLVCVPIVAAFWRYMARRKRNPSASYKLALGLLSLAVAYGILVFAEATRFQGLPSVIWLVVAYAFFGLGDVFVWSNQISLTSKLAPARYAPLMIGGWYVCIGIGTWLTGYVGALIERYSFNDIFVGLTVAHIAVAVILVLITPTMQRFMHGAETLDAA